MYCNWNLVSVKGNTGFRVIEKILGYSNFYGNVLLIVLHATYYSAFGVNTEIYFLSST